MDLTEPDNPLVNVDARYAHAAGAGVAVRPAALGPRAVPPYLADGGLLAMEGGPGVPPGSERFFHADMLGTTRLLTDGDGNVSQSLAFTAFGELLGTAPASTPRYDYAGAWGYQADATDAQGAPLIDLPFVHVGARYYDPMLGRFAGRDPIGIFGGLNVYAYVAGVPTVATDPGGLWVEFTLPGQALVQKIQLAMREARAEGYALQLNVLKTNVDIIRVEMQKYAIVLMTEGGWYAVPLNAAGQATMWFRGWVCTGIPPL